MYTQNNHSNNKYLIWKGCNIKRDHHSVLNGLNHDVPMKKIDLHFAFSSWKMTKKYMLTDSFSAIAFLRKECA